MKKASIIAAILLIAGAAIMIGALASVGFDFKKLGTVKFETNTYTAEGTFDSIRIDEDIADVVFRQSEDATCRIECFESEKTSHTVAVENGTLTIAAQKKNWTRFMDISFETPKVTIYLPEGAYRTLTVGTHTGDIDVPEWLSFESVTIQGDTSDVFCRASASNGITVRTSTGGITLNGMSAGSVECAVSTGNIRMQNVTCTGDVHAKMSTGDLLLSDLTCRNLSTEGSTGDVTLRNVVASGSLSIERSTGDVRLESSDAAEIRISTSTGDVTGTLRSEKVFITHTSTGDVNVPASAAGGKCEIKTSTGDVTIGIASGK